MDLHAWTQNMTGKPCLSLVVMLVATLCLHCVTGFAPGLSQTTQHSRSYCGIASTGPSSGFLVPKICTANDRVGIHDAWCARNLPHLSFAPHRQSTLPRIPLRSSRKSEDWDSLLSEDGDSLASDVNREPTEAEVEQSKQFWLELASQKLEKLKSERSNDDNADPVDEKLQLSEVLGDVLAPVTPSGSCLSIEL